MGDFRAIYGGVGTPDAHLRLPVYRFDPLCDVVPLLRVLSVDSLERLIVMAQEAIEQRKADRERWLKQWTLYHGSPDPYIYVPMCVPDELPSEAAPPDSPSAGSDPPSP